jgi:hypothetical protein
MSWFLGEVMSTAFTCPHCGMPQHAAPASLPPGAVCPGCGRPLHAASVAPGAPPPPVVLPAEARYADDRWQQPEPVAGPPPAIPGSVRAAGIIGIIFGALILLNGAVLLLFLLVLSGQAQQGAGGAVASGVVCVGLFVALIGGVFIHVGIQSLGGTAKDTLGNGIGSIIFAALIGGSGLIRLVALGVNWVEMIGAVVNLLGGAALLLAGVLALVERDGYRAYRRFHHSAPPPRRRY